MGFGGALKAPQYNQGRYPEGTGIGVFWGFKNHQFLSTTHYSPAILTANFNDLALPLDMTVFDQNGLKLQQGGPKPKQMGLSPGATPHFNQCYQGKTALWVSR